MEMGPASEEELAVMRTVTAEAMEDGALRVSSSTAGSREPGQTGSGYVY